MKVLSLVVHKLWPKLKLLSTNDDNNYDDVADNNDDAGAMTIILQTFVTVNLKIGLENYVVCSIVYVPWQWTSVLEVEDLVRIEKFAEGRDELGPLASTTFGIHKNQQGIHIVRYHVCLK